MKTMEDIFEKSLRKRNLSLRSCFYVIHNISIYLSTISTSNAVFCVTFSVQAIILCYLSIIIIISLHWSVWRIIVTDVLWSPRCELMLTCAGLVWPGCLINAQLRVWWWPALAGPVASPSRPAHSGLHSTPQPGLAPATGNQSTGRHNIWRHLHLLHLLLTITITARPGTEYFLPNIFTTPELHGIISWKVAAEIDFFHQIYHPFFYLRRCTL